MVRVRVTGPATLIVFENVAAPVVLNVPAKVLLAVSDAASVSSLLVVSRHVLNESDSCTLATGEPENTIVIGYSPFWYFH